MKEYVGYKEPIADGLFNMGVTDEEIIRCRDCKTYTPETIKFMDGTYGSDVELVPFCDKLRRETKPDNFCSWAERDDR